MARIITNVLNYMWKKQLHYKALIKLFSLELPLVSLQRFSFFGIIWLLFCADSSLLISDFESQQPSAEAGTEDEFDPIPVTGRKNSQGMSLHSPLGSTGWERWFQKKMNRSDIY